MTDFIYITIFRFLRFCIRLFTPRYQDCSTNKSVVPAVYIVHHQNLKGPFTCMLWFTITLKPWVLSVFCNQKSCFRHYYNYTFTKRFGIPKIFAVIIAFPVSFCVSIIMKSINAIPVYRGSREIAKTFTQSITALFSGQSILICPDIDYTDTCSDMGDMYSGFLDLEKFYFKLTGIHLAFIPLYISHYKKCIYIGNAVYFNNECEFKKEKLYIYERLKKEFLRLENPDVCTSRF